MKKGSSKTTKGTKTSRKASRAEAARLAHRYRVMISEHPEGGFFGQSVEMPGVLGRGDTEIECLKDMRDALTETILVTYEQGEEPPSPASEGKRDVQFNLRFTADERIRIEERARIAGFTSVADYIRRAALRYTG